MDLMIKFTDPSNSFTLGCEYGRLLEKFEKGVTVIENNGFPVHLENKEVLISTCIKFNYIPLFGEVYFNEWVEFKAIKNDNLN
jgi:hypothetical protein